MSKGYWIVESDIGDMEQHGEYVKANRAVEVASGSPIAKVEGR